MKKVIYIFITTVFVLTIITLTSAQSFEEYTGNGMAEIQSNINRMKSKSKSSYNTPILPIYNFTPPADSESNYRCFIGFCG